jgi:hypothetical protein
MFEADGRHFRPAELATGQEPPVTGDHLELGIDQDRHIEAECLDAAGDLPDLLVAVSAGIGRIGLPRLDSQIA